MTERRKPGQASLEEHPKKSGRFRVRARIDGKLKTLASGVSEAEAEEAAAAFTVLRDAEIVREGVTLSQFGVGFLNRRERRGVRGIKQERARWSVYIDRRGLGALPVSHVRRRDIIEWLDDLQAKGLATQTRRNARNLLNTALQEAVDRELLTGNPCRDVKVRRDGTQEEDLAGVLFPLDQQALIQACDTETQPIVLFAMLTGLRLSEQWWLKWEDIHEDYIVVRRSVGGKATKSGKTRRVPLIGAAQAIMRSLPRTTTWVFPAPRSGRRHYGHRPKGWATALQSANLGRSIRWHDLRHTCGTSLLAGWWGRVWSLEEVRGFLGHSTVKVTERYARILDSSVQNAAAGTLFPVSSQELPTAKAETAVLNLRRGPDSNRRVTVLQSGDQSNDLAALPPRESPNGDESSQPVPVEFSPGLWALAEAANRLGVLSDRPLMAAG